MVSTAVFRLASRPPPVGLLSVRVKVWLPSARLLFKMGMVKVLLVSPEAKVSVPEVAV